MNPAPSPADSRILWLGLHLTPNLGARGIERLMENFGAIEAIYQASLTELEACQIAPAAAQYIHDGRALAEGEREFQAASLLGIEILTRGDHAYPPLLAEIPDPPFVMYVRGSAAKLQELSIAVVGTRHPTPYGRLMTERLGAGLAQSGLAVVSGLARGIDSLAQKACLDAGGLTIAVLGTGVDVIYPRENTALANAILEKGGVLLSEFALGTPATPQNFPIRNRLISGLSLGVLVVEGGEHSGSRITARLALEQNRDLYAIPGLVTQKQAWLPNHLIREGGKLVRMAEDILEELPTWVKQRLQPLPGSRNTGEPTNVPARSSLAEPARRVLSALRLEEATQLEVLQDRLGGDFTPAKLLALLFELELSGWVRQMPGQFYVRAH